MEMSEEVEVGGVDVTTVATVDNNDDGEVVGESEEAAD